MLTVIILSTMFIVGFPASAKATTLNGKAVSKGQIVTVTYRIKAPKLMEDIQAHVDYTVTKVNECFIQFRNEERFFRRKPQPYKTNSF